MITTCALGLLLAVQTPTLDARIASVVPKQGTEKWLEIPWRTNIMQARADAQRAGKPLFLWIMNGNPLGCT